MRIMTSNIWGYYFGNPPEERIDAIEATFRKYNPDILGIQELCPGWFKSGLIERLSDEYTFVGAFTGNYSPLLFKTEEFDLIEQGWIKYIYELDLPEIYDDISKSVTWAVLEEKKSGKKIGVCNTHLWWKPGDRHEIIREGNAKQLLSAMKSIKEKYGDILVFACGDFNSHADGMALKYLNASNVFSAYDIAKVFSPNSSHHGDPVRGEDGKYHGSKTSDDKTFSLDHIVTFKGDVDIELHKVVEDQEILDATDHSPVYIDFEF